MDSSISKTVLILEAFYGGSHKQLADLLLESFSQCQLYSMTAKKWHWRMRTSALHFSKEIPTKHNFRLLFCSSVINLPELFGLRPDLAHLTKILYFHENQLIYPVQANKERDFQLGFNQIISCLVADKIIFNSTFNMKSFLSSIPSFLKSMPDYRPKDIQSQLVDKCSVVYFPIKMDYRLPLEQSSSNEILHIVWAHRWEHDKDPDSFFSALFLLKETGYDFKISVLGEQFTEQPEIFTEAKEKLSGSILTWGYLESKESYFSVLCNADVAVSTAKHEFFGVSMLEAVMLGCYPLCPRRLVYPEIFPDECLYNTIPQLVKKLKRFCKNPQAARQLSKNIETDQFKWQNLKDVYQKLLQPIS